DHEPFTGAKQLVGDHQRPNRVFAGPASRIADHVGVAFGEPGKLRGIEARVHASQDGEAASGRKRQSGPVAEAGSVLLVRDEYILQYGAHVPYLLWVETNKPQLPCEREPRSMRDV